MNKHRVLETVSYMLHATAWRETSLIIQIFSRNYGLVSAVAKGAKRPHSSLRPALNIFQRINASWSGAGEVKTLTKAESIGIMPLEGRFYMSAWYMNELLIKLLPKEDPHPKLFDAYQSALQQLCNFRYNGLISKTNESALLRSFEWALLQELGYGVDGDMPDFNLTENDQAMRLVMRKRLQELIGKPLQTRQVMMDLMRS